MPEWTRGVELKRKFSDTGMLLCVVWVLESCCSRQQLHVAVGDARGPPGTGAIDLVEFYAKGIGDKETPENTRTLFVWSSRYDSYSFSIQYRIYACK
jgi:hypothetical protein